MHDHILNTETEYWGELLDNYTNVAKIPQDNYHDDYEEVITFESMSLDTKLHQSLIDYSNNNGISIEIIVDVIYALILQKHSYSEDVVFGKTLDSIPLRIYYKDNLKFVDLAKKVQHQWIRSVEYANNPFIYIENDSILKDKLINTVCFFKEYKTTECLEKLNKLYDILVMISIEDTLKISIGYNDNIYKVDTVNRILDQFLKVFKQVLRNESILLEDIELISGAERKKLLYEFNDNDKDIPLHKNYIELFSESVKRYSNNIAVQDERMSLKYRDLNIMSDKLGAYLNHIGVKLEDRVAVILPRNLNFVIAALSIVKAGASFFPIDTNNPKERMEYLLEDSNAKAVITTEDFFDKVSTIGASIIDIEDSSYLVTNYKFTEKILPDNSAYTISTSGSTGRPKMISIEHRSLINMCYYSNEYINVTEKDICGVYLSFSFDAVIKQIFPYLLVGATVDIMPEESKFNEYTVNEYCEESDITVLALPTALAKLFIKNCSNFSLRVLQAGGERLKGFKEREYKVYNEYGPAEFTVLCTSFYVDKHYDNVPIGSTINNTKAYVLDKNDKLCPIGVPGELCLSGIQISRGYINNEELNKLSFVDNPFKRDEYTEKMYRTGDLVRWLKDGNLEYIGRLDNQVRIGEFRIELFEIENTINRIKQIKSSVCVAKEDEEGEVYLIAYYVVDEHDYENVNSKTIREYLEKQLPEYMIPKIIVRIDKVPVTPIGKVNKRALPF